MTTAAQQTNNNEEEPTPPKSEALAPTIVREISTSVAPDVMAIIEERNRGMERMVEYAIRSTRPEQWCDQGGQPYLMAGGAQAVARRMGIKTTDVSETREKHQDEGGAFYEYVSRATFSLPGAYDRVEGVIGSCTSRDAFIGTKGAERALSDIDPGDIRKKAWTNMFQRGVTALLGLRGLSWETLAKYGIARDGAAQVEYKHGAKGGGQSGAGGYTFAFGKNKGKAPSELDEKDLGWYAQAFESSLADPARAKFKSSNEKGLAEVKGELARRANVKSGATAPAANGQAPTMWQRIQTLAQDYEFPRGEKDADLIAAVKKATGNKPGKELTEDDFKKIEAAIAKAAKENKDGNDIPY